MAAGEFTTRDLSLAGFLSARGLVLRKAARDPMSGDFQFVLEDPKGEAERLKVAWVNSCCRQHESAVMALKSMMRSNGH